MSSQHVQIARISAPESMQISDCIVEQSSFQSSPIEQFEASLAVLARVAASMQSSPDPSVIGEMLSVGAVASVESYFRGVLAEMAHNCPITAGNIADAQITYGAVRAYPQSMTALATLERSLFSSTGVIETEIKRFTRFDVPKNSELHAAIRAFELACVCRHSVAHWRGFLDSKTMKSLGLLETSSKRYQIDATYKLVQRVLAACDHLVHVANQVLYELTVRKWTENSRLTLEDASDKEDRKRCSELISMFGSRNGAVKITPAPLQRKLIAQYSPSSAVPIILSAVAPPLPPSAARRRDGGIRKIRTRPRLRPGHFGR